MKTRKCMQPNAVNGVADFLEPVLLPPIEFANEPSRFDYL